MSIFVKTTIAREPKTEDSKKIAYMYAFILVVFALCQLFTFDDFLNLLDSFWLPGGMVTAYLLGSSIVISEVFALSFLLRMKTSPLMRIVSMVFGWLLPIIWLAISLWLGLTINSVSNIGILGTVVELAPGWWVIFFSISIGILSAWASWGLWPIERK